ncbi:ATP-binding protein [Rhizobium sp. BK176]|uniref:ATP-binding protein n=1 Tax=Rhizobium sp. BK176 TaxID=2587071 RepID=UPI00216AAA80|nr:ATP-binding protein [Rhizobium sp. BK176]MCS4089721.1 signal transduction histidine kinase [Rhizobium sp. BK176]
MERLRKAALKLRRNRRDLRIERGLATTMTALDDDYVPLGDDAVFAGVDATPEELVLYSENQLNRERAKIGLLTKWALAGLATEMTMHETNGLLSALRYDAEHFASTYPQDKRVAGLKWTVKRLDDDFSFLSRFKQSTSGYYPKAAQAIEMVKHEFTRALGNGDLVIETTDAFLKSDFAAESRALLSVFSNLVRNGYQWAYNAGKKPAVVRFDVQTVEYMGEDYDEETDTSTPVLKRKDIVIVADNGPGVRPGMGDSVFDPSISGRGSAGIGLHLCRAVLEAGGNTIVLSDEKSELGGAVFKIGGYSLLRPDQVRTPKASRPREAELADALDSMVELVREGFNAEAADLSDVYEEAAGLAMRIRLRGSESPLDERLVDAVDAFDEAVRSARPITGPKLPSP